MPSICRGCTHWVNKGLYIECALGNRNLKMKVPGDYTSFECSDRFIDEEREQ